MNKARYWAIYDFYTLSKYSIGVVISIIIVLVIGIPVRDEVRLFQWLGLEQYYGNVLDTLNSWMVISLISTAASKWIIGWKGKCGKCKHNLFRHENKRGIPFEGGCKMKIPQQFSILKTQRCACMEFTFEKELKHGELRDPYTGFIVSRKNQIIVIGSWIVVATVLRYALLEADPYKWIGSLGAVTLTFALFYFSFKHIKKLFPYKQMFNTVMQNWYRNHYFRVGYIIFTAYTIFFVFTLQYGHDHFDTALNVAKTTHREFVPSFDGNVTKIALNNQNQSSKVYLVQMDPNDAVRIFQLFALLQSSMDSDFHSLLGTANWVMIYEEIEVAIFFVMMRTGRIFR